MLTLLVGSSAAVAAGKPGFRLEHCANGPFTAPVQCNVASGKSGYTRGNLNASKSHYFEGDSVPARIVATGLSVGQSYTVTVGYDFTVGGVLAIDYLTNFDRTEPTSDPCASVAGCSLGSVSTFPIPLDPVVAGSGVTQLSGQSFSIFGGTITGVSGYSHFGSAAANSTTQITLTFTANQPSVVIAYGLHLSTQVDWGANNSSGFVSGSLKHFVAAFPGVGSGMQSLAISAPSLIVPPA